MTNKIKILYALEAAGGGVLRHVTNLTTHLDNKKFEIRVVIPNTNYAKDTKHAIYKMSNAGVAVDVIRINKKLSVYDLISFYHIYCYLKTHKFDIIHSHSSKAGFIFRVTNLFFIHKSISIHTPHCFYFNAHQRFLKYIYIFIEKILSKITDIIIISETEKKSIVSYNITNTEKIKVINNAIEHKDILYINKKEIKKYYGIPEDKFIILGIGRLVKQKNWVTFINVAQYVINRNNNFFFIIAGDGPMYNEIINLINKYNISKNIKLVGHIENTEQIYSVTNFYLSTSLYEGLPYTYLDAASFNLPMLLTQTEGFEFYQKYFGAKCLPNDYKKIGEYILSNMNIKTASYKLPPQFSIRFFIEEHETVYKNIFNRSLKDQI